MSFAVKTLAVTQVPLEFTVGKSDHVSVQNVGANDIYMTPEASAYQINPASASFDSPQANAFLWLQVGQIKVYDFIRFGRVFIQCAQGFTSSLRVEEWDEVNQQ